MEPFSEVRRDLVSMKETLQGLVESTAFLSACRTWRYSLTRTWGGAGEALVVIGLNPSKADESEDDPTIRRCIGFARAWGHPALCMLNLFAFRATDPADMHAHTKRGGDPIGPENDATIRRETAGRRVLCAWGSDELALGRDLAVVKLLEGRELVCLGKTKGGKPRHPLYIRADTQPIPFALESARAW